MGPLTGVRVVELGMWIAVPATGALPADWGAEVCKIESPTGDPFRHIMTSSGYAEDIPNAPFTLDNRGKLSVALDLSQQDARSSFDDLLGTADVFLTNLRLNALERLGLAPDRVRERHPPLVYSLITGYGSTGPDRDRPGYDAGAFGARTGIVHQMRSGEAPPVALPLGFGDHVVALAACAGICAALVQRTRGDGTGQLVETSLFRTGIYALGWDNAVQLMLGKVPRATERTETPTPMFNCYRAADGHWFWLLGVEADRHFPGVATAIDRPELLDDERFATAKARRRNRQAIIAILDDAFAAAPFAHWAELFDTNDVWWAKVQSPAEVAADPQALDAGAFVTVGETDVRTVATPVDFSDHPRKSVAAPPLLGAHNDHIWSGIDGGHGGR